MKVNRPSATAAHKRLVTAERTDRRRTVYYSSVSASAPLFYHELSLDRRVVGDLTFTTTTTTTAITTPPRSEITRLLTFSGLPPSPARPSSVCFYPTKRIQTRRRTKNPFRDQKKITHVSKTMFRLNPCSLFEPSRCMCRMRSSDDTYPFQTTKRRNPTRWDAHRVP